MKTFDMTIEKLQGVWSMVKDIPYRTSFEMGGYTFAVHKRYYPAEGTVKPWEHEWDVSEITSGGRVFSGYTSKKGTIESAKARLNTISPDRLNEAIEHGRKKKEGIQS